jgi:hypothetical protein
MDENAQTDGVFLGRYVLVEYDNDSNLVKAYLKKADGAFYADPVYSTPIEGKAGLLYQNILDPLKFYIYNEEDKSWVLAGDNVYATNY